MAIVTASQSQAVTPCIASTSLASDEIAFTLLQKAGRLHELCSLSARVDEPQHSNISQLVKSIKHRFTGEVESLIKLRPSLVLAATYNRPELLHILKKSQIDVVLIDRFSSLPDIENNIQVIGHKLGLSKHSDAMREDMSAYFKKASTGLSHKPTVLIFFGDYQTMSDGTIPHEIITKLGFTNLASTWKLKGWPQLSVEKIATANPDYIIAASRDKSQSIKQLQSLPGWKNLAAVKKQKIIFVEPAALLALSPYVVDAAEQILHGLKHAP